MPRQPKAVILAGGMGTRLQPYTFFVPKPMLPLGDKPLLEHLVLWLKKNGVSEFVFSVGYLGKTMLAVMFQRQKSLIIFQGEKCMDSITS